jgi:hypothetical protein
MRKNCYQSIGVLAAALAATGWLLWPVAVLAGNGSGDKEHKVHGRVISVTPITNGAATITVEIHKHKKNDGTAAADAAKPEVVTKTFDVTASTQFEVVTDQGSTPATFDAIKPGEHVLIEAKKHVADKVAIVHHKKNAAAPVSNTNNNPAAPVSNN